MLRTVNLTFPRPVEGDSRKAALPPSRGLVPEPAPGRRRNHFTANIVIDLAGDSATVLSNFLVARQRGGPAIAVAGTYADTVVRTAESWKFKSRKRSHDIAGESGLNVKESRLL